MNIKNLILGLMVVLSANMVNAQVSKVQYGIAYNQSTCMYDAYIFVEEGVADDYRSRIQLNSQFSVVVPTGSQFNIEKSFAPFHDNKERNSAKVANWSVGNFVENPASLEGSDVYTVTPSVIPTASYNDLVAGEKTTLFSFSVYPMVSCGEGIRVFNNDNDPTSSDAGMYGGDYSNSFTLGGIESSYYGSKEELHPSTPRLSSISYNIKTNTVEVSAQAMNPCSGNISYEWYNPAGQKISDINTISNQAMVGKYTVIARDEMGCKAVKSFHYGVDHGGEIVLDDKQEVANTTSTNDVSAVQGAINVFPNPAKNFANVSIDATYFGSSVAISIIDVKGQVVNKASHNIQANNINQINIPLSLTSGVYTLRFEGENKTTASKNLIIVE